MVSSGAQPEIFQGRGGFVKLGHFNKYFINNSRKKGPTGKNFTVLSPRYSYNYILSGKFNLSMDINGALSKIRALFWIFKKGRGVLPPPPPLPPTSAPEYNNLKAIQNNLKSVL